MVTYTEDSDWEDEDSVIPLLIYPEDTNSKDFLSDPTSMEPTPEPGPLREKNAEN